MQFSFDSLCILAVAVLPVRIFCALAAGSTSTAPLLSALVMEKLFWQSRLSPASMTAITAVLMVAINAVVWFLVVKAVGTIRARLFTHSGVSTRS
jgi:hypothetical protein